jgi:hypothetical protein
VFPSSTEDKDTQTELDDRPPKRLKKDHTSKDDAVQITASKEEVEFNFTIYYLFIYIYF